MAVTFRSRSLYIAGLMCLTSSLMGASGIVPAYGGEKVLHSFHGRGDGANPYGGLIADSAGNLYGTTGSGGGAGCGLIGCGTVFKVLASGGEKALYSFQGGSDGWGPGGTLLADATGNLYGATESGGSTACPNGCGTVFEVSPDGTETQLYTFLGGSDGLLPWSNLIADSSGNLYGLTGEGGSYEASECAQYGCGTVFELQPNGSKVTLYAFQGGSDGAYPDGGGLIADGSGNFYGTTSSGGTGCNGGGCGTVFKLTPGGSEVVLYAFQGNDDGQFPHGGLISDSSGNLYGTTLFGGTSGAGTVFEVTAAGQETVLYSFKEGSDGGYPEAGLIMDKKGNLYGTTLGGGGPGCKNSEFESCGTIFELSPKGVETILYRFDKTQGSNPAAGLLSGAHGALFGTTTKGGKKNDGVVFELKK